MNAPGDARMRPEDLQEAARQLRAAGSRMIMVYPLTLADGATELRYVSSVQGTTGFTQWRVQVDGEVPSLVEIWPLLSWYEREAQDTHGIRFTGHPEPEPLIATITDGTTMRRLPDVEGEQLQVLPFGPVRAGVVESAEFTFLYMGEAILHYAPHLFLKRRGMEARFAGRDVETGAVLAERISGVGSAAHAIAYAQAVEAACRCTIPPRAHYLRVVVAELERLYNHLYYLGHLADTTTLKVGHAEGALLSERIKQINGRVSGSRFLRGVVGPGGVRRDLRLDGLASSLEALRAPIRRYIDRLDKSGSYFDRLATTGILPCEVAFDQGATGPVARASGLVRDLRHDHPYGGYREPTLAVTPASHADGDAYARAQVRIAEIWRSLELVAQAADNAPVSALRAECRPVPGGEALGFAESPRGTLVYGVHLGADGKLARVKVKSPSFSNWRVFPFTVHGTNMMDYAINEASFGMTIAGCAR